MSQSCKENMFVFHVCFLCSFRRTKSRLKATYGRTPCELILPRTSQTFCGGYLKFCFRTLPISEPWLLRHVIFSSMLRLPFLAVVSLTSNIPWTRASLTDTFWRTGIPLFDCICEFSGFGTLSNASLRKRRKKTDENKTGEDCTPVQSSRLPATETGPARVL